MMLRRLLFVSIITHVFCQCFIIQSLHAQETNLRFEQISVEDGISDVRTLKIFQDSKGFIWFGTYEGLNRYDGYSYTIYRPDPNDSTSIPGNYVNCIYEDRAGNIWIGTVGATNGVGLCKYDPQTDAFIGYIHDPNDSTSIGLNNVQTIYQTTDGYIWLSSFQGLDRYDPVSGTFKHFKRDPEDPSSITDVTVFLMYEDKRGNFWLGDGWIENPSRGGLHLYDPVTETFTRYDHDPNDPSSLRTSAVLTAMEDSHGNFGVGTVNDGLHLMDRDQGTFTHFPYDPKNEQALSGPYGKNSSFLKNMLEDLYGRLWFSGGEDLVVYDPKTKLVSRFGVEINNPNSLSGDFVWSMIMDHSGNIWLGGGGGLLDKVILTPTIFFEYPTDSPPANLGGEVRAIVNRQDGLLWIGTDKGMGVFDPVKGKFQPFQPASGLDIRAIYQDHSSSLFYGESNTMVYKYDFTTKEVVQFPRLLDNSQRPALTDILVTNTDTLWVGTWHSGLFRYEEAENRFIQYMGKGIGADCLLQDRKGTLWIGGAGKVARYDPKNDQIIPVIDGPPNKLYEDRKGNFWIGTDGMGLWLYDRVTQKKEIFTIKDGLASNSIFNIAEDSLGNLWLATGKKISKFDPVSKKFRNYDARDNVSNHFSHNSRNALAYGKHGAIYFGGLKGITQINTQATQPISVAPLISITQIQTASDTLSLIYRDIQKLSFPHNENTILIEYVGLHYTNPAQNQYQYKLDGFDKDWIQAGTIRQARYTNLSPGTYTFRVKAFSSEGMESEEEATLEITIYPPWWANIWAYIIYVVLVIGILSLIRWNELKKQEKKLEAERAKLDQERKVSDELRRVDALKDQFLANTSHELRTPLNGIAVHLSAKI